MIKKHLGNADSIQVIENSNNIEKSKDVSVETGEVHLNPNKPIRKQVSIVDSPSANKRIGYRKNSDTSPRHPKIMDDNTPAIADRSIFPPLNIPKQNLKP
jgi:hypothetical protein